MSNNATPPVDSDAEIENLPDPDATQPGLNIYSQTRIFYWWPIWAFGFVLAFITRVGGEHVEGQRMDEYIHADSRWGATYVVLLILVIIFTNFSFRGAASLGVGAVVIIVSLLASLNNWWDNIFNSFFSLSIHMNSGFYLFFSTLLFVLWCYSTLIHVRLNYHRVRPGLISKVGLIGEGERNYDTRGAVLEKFREDFFRHWLLGLGSGDIKISTTGARSEEIRIKDVMFVDRKIKKIRKLMSVQPETYVSE